MSSAENKTIAMTAPLDAAADVRVYRFYWLKRLAVLLIVGGLGLTAIWLAWAARERRKLSAEEENWRKDGLTLTVSELQDGEVPDDQNAAMSLIASGQAFIDDSAYEELFHDYKFDIRNLDKWTPDKQRVIDAMLEHNARALALVHRASTQPGGRWPGGMTGGFRSVSPYVRGVADVTNILMVHAERALLQGDEITFLDDARVLHAVRRVLVGNPSILAHYVAWNQSETSNDLISRYIPRLSFSAAGPEERRSAERLLAEMLNEPAPIDDLTEALEWEAQQAVETVRAGGMIQYRTPMPPGVVGTMAWRVLRPAAMERMVAALVIARRDIHTIRAQPFAMPSRLWNGMPPTRRPREIEPAESILLGFWPQMESADQWVGRAYVAALSHRLACVVLACRLYSLDHEGHNPSNLAELAPKYLPAVPLDPYDKAMGPLRYTTATTRPFVYSIGPGGQDRIVTGQRLPREEGSGWGFNPGKFVGRGRPATQPK